MNTETTSTTNNFMVALFKDSGNAQNAIRDLHSAGFKAHEIGAAVGEPTAAGADREEHHRSFWQMLFGGGDDYSDENVDTVEDVSDDTTLHLPSSYVDRLRSGSYLVAVLAGARQQEATSILTRNKGEMQSDYARDYANARSPQSTVPAAATTSATRGANERGDRIQLLSERLRIHKERVPTGEARLHKEVVTEQKTMQVPVSHEELVIERAPVSGDVAAQGNVGTASDIRIPLSAERVTVDKQPVVREEVRVGKKTVQETQNVTESVRREELKVENDVKRGKDAVRDTDVTDPLKRKSA
ncbi:MAG: YsnF/AvaK domain-containing protein [Acidobacteriaceae bacterium]